MRGRFITVEGVDGAGKTTQLKFINSLLESAAKPFLQTREPGGTALAEDLRRLLLQPRPETMLPTAELLLVFAARADHLERVIKPALAQGQWVLCERFTDATYAYQGGGRGIATERIAWLEEWVQGSLRPDLTLLFDVPLELGLQRAAQRGQADRFEREGRAFFARVRAAYLNRAARDTQRYRVIDASDELATVQTAIAQALRPLL